MHFIGVREKGSKIYLRNIQSIALATDREHEKINESANTEPIHVQQKKNIDKIILGVVKERMFGELLIKDNRTSFDTYHTIELLSKGRSRPTQRTYQSRELSKNSMTIDLPYQKRKSSCQEHLNMDSNGSQSNALDVETIRRKRSMSVKFPQLLAKKINSFQELAKKEQSHVHKKLKINEKKQLERFKMWMGGNINNVQAYDTKVTREIIINKYKNVVNAVLLQRFFHFFNFPYSFTLRQFCTQIENAANCSIKFIYFWVFGLFDENCNGILQSQDLFRFLQKFGTDNSEIQSEIYQIKNYLQLVEGNFKPREQKQLTQEMLIGNHNLKLDELKDLLKESQKERIDVDCVKSTCYHQSLLSIEHDYIERDKLQKIEDNQLSTKKLKDEMNQIRAKLQNTPGLRLRDFYAIYNKKRPKIFRFFIKLLTGEEISIFE